MSALGKTGEIFRVIKGIVFDCFGVFIADDVRAQIDAVAQVNAEQGQALRDIVKATDRGMISAEESAQQLVEMGVAPNMLNHSLGDRVIKNTELVDFTRTLRPQFKVAMLSNVRGRDRLEELFPEGELDELFDVVVASGDVGIAKPEREVFELTAEKLGVLPEECVMIDDLSRYCEGAEAAGMRAIQFTDNDQAIAELRALIDSKEETN